MNSRSREDLPAPNIRPRQRELGARRHAETKIDAHEPRFPPNFPAYRATQSLNEAAAYLANERECDEGIGTFSSRGEGRERDIVIRQLRMPSGCICRPTVAQNRNGSV